MVSDTAEIGIFGGTGIYDLMNCCRIAKKL